MRPSINASLRALPALIWVLYVLLIPIHLFSSDHYFSQDAEDSHHSQSEHHHHDYDSDSDDGHIPHFAGDHALNFTVQKSLSFSKVDLAVNSISNLASDLEPIYRESLLIPTDTRPISGAPPTLQDSRAPPSI